MAKNTSVKKNFLYQMMYEVLVIILPFVTSPYIARVIGAEGLGIYSFSNSVAYYFVLVSMLGLKNYGNRTIASVRNDKEKLNETFSEIYVLHAIFSVICIAAYFVYCLEISSDKKYALIQTFYVISSLFDISWFYFGIEKFKLTVTRGIVIKSLNAVCVFTFVKDGDDLWKYCLIMSLGMLLSQMSLWLPLRRYTRIVKPDTKNMYTHIKPMLILFIPAIAVSLYKYMDKIMIGGLSGKAQLGYYENAEKVNNIPITIIGSFGTVMLPKMSNLASKADKAVSRRYMAQSFQFVMMMAFALAFGVASVGKPFSVIFWGDNFYLSGVIIMWLSVTIPFISFANILRTQYLIPNRRDKEYTISVMLGAVVNLLLNYILIPKYGAIGASYGTIAAEVTVCMIQTFSVRKELPLIQYTKSFIFFLFDGAVMFSAVYAETRILSVSIPNLVIEVATGAAIYALLALFYFVITKNELFYSVKSNLMQKLFKKKAVNHNEQT